MLKNSSVPRVSSTALLRNNQLVIYEYKRPSQLSCEDLLYSFLHSSAHIWISYILNRYLTRKLLFENELNNIPFAAATLKHVNYLKFHFFQLLFFIFIFISFYILYLHMYLHYTYFLHDAYTTLTCTTYNTYITIQ